MHYVWLYEGPQWKTKAMAAAVVAGIFAVVLFPLWPMFMRQGVWYLSVGFMILLGLFFAMAIFRLILFCVTVFVVPPGLWLFPNLFEDVGVIDSFKPLWGWQEVCSLSFHPPWILSWASANIVNRQRRKSPRKHLDQSPVEKKLHRRLQPQQQPQRPILPVALSREI